MLTTYLGGMFLGSSRQWRWRMRGAGLAGMFAVWDLVILEVLSGLVVSSEAWWTDPRLVGDCPRPCFFLQDIVAA